MSIQRFIFDPPLNLKDESEFDLETAILFAKGENVPPSFKKEITPIGYRDRYILRTIGVVNRLKREDTVGEIEVIQGKQGQVISYVEGNRGGEGGEPILREEKGQRIKRQIDENTPVFVLARPNVLDGGEGVRIDGVVRYLMPGVKIKTG